MKKLLPVILLFMGFLLCGKAQESNLFRPDRLNVSYFGSHFTHPGLKLELEKVTWEKNYVKAKRQRSKRHEVFLAPSIGFYNHWRYQKGFFLQATPGYRHIGHRGFTKEVRIGFGLLQTFVPNTFEVGENGELSRNRFAGNTYFMPSVSLGLGKDIPDSPWGYHIRPMVFWYMPHFAKPTMNFVLEAGVSRRLVD